MMGWPLQHAPAPVAPHPERARLQAAAAAAWTRGKEYLNGYLKIVNGPINAKVGDKFDLVGVSI